MAEGRSAGRREAYLDVRLARLCINSPEMQSIPLARPWLGNEEVQAVAKVIQSRWVTQGPWVAQFEGRFGGYLGVPHAVAVTSATTALHLALLAAGIRPGDEVICPSFSFIASANCIRYVGARPVFVDIDPRTFNLDPDLVQRAVTPATKAILVVHQLGLAADLDAIRQLAHRLELMVIEDAACAVGSRHRGCLVGSDAALACFSFHPRKLITTGEGGMVVTRDPSTADRVRQLRSHGASISDLARHQAKNLIAEEYTLLGYNYRLTDIQAAVGLTQMDRLPAILARHAEIAHRYSAALAGVEEVEVPFVPDYANPNFQSYLIRLTAHCRPSRDDVVQAMVAKGVSCRRGIAPIHLEPVYRPIVGNLRLPATEQAAESTMYLPIFAEMTDQQVTFVVDALKEALAPGGGAT